MIACSFYTHSTPLSSDHNPLTAIGKHLTTAELLVQTAGTANAARLLITVAADLRLRQRNRS